MRTNADKHGDEDARAGAGACPSKADWEGRRVFVVVGGWIDAEKRRAVEAGERPRVDVLEMERRFGARVIDFSSIEAARGLKGRVARWLARRGQWSLATAALAFPEVRDADVTYVTGEDVGIPLASLLRVFGGSTRVVLRMEQPTYGRTTLRQMVHLAHLRFGMARVERTLCRTRAHEQYLASVLRIPAERRAFLPESTDVAFFAAGEGSPGADDVAHVVSAGLEMRDYETLTAAVEGLPVRVTIAAGSQWTNPAVSTGRLPSNVTTGTFGVGEMRRLYASATIVVVPVKPTLRACGMNVILEAWAAGRPVIASATSGLRDYGEDGTDLLFVPPEDPEALRRAIRRLLQAPAERDRLGAAGKERVARELHIDRYVDGVEAALLDTVRA